MTREHPTAFGTLLRRYRTAVRLTQEELAEQAGISLRGVAALETGERLRPRRDTVQLLADALHLTDETRLHFEAAARGREGDEPSGSSLPPLVGRAAELELLEWHLEGQGPIVLVFAGEPGIGKTRLLRHAAKQAVQKGQVVVRGGCQRRSGQEPYAPFAQVLARYLATLSADARNEAVRESRWLVRLLPELAPSLPEQMVSSWLASAQERRLLFDAVVRLFVHLATPTGALLLLDDLQWAPTDALDLLTALVQDPAMTHLRVVCAYRSTEVRATDPLAMMLADLSHAGLARQRMVAALSPQESEQLLTSLVGASHHEREEVQRAIDRTGGVPFYLVSYAQELETKGEALSGEVPWDVAHSLRQRVAALPLHSQEILEVAAVAGRVVPWVLLASVIGRSDGEVLDGLGTVCASRLLEDAGGDAYQFPHDVVREVIEADLGSARRKLLHRRIAEALERLPERDKRVAELAWHFLEADNAERALHFSLLAGDEAAGVFAHEEAERHYRRAASLAHDVHDETREADALEKQGRVLRILRHQDEALAALERAMEMQQRAGNLDAEGRIAAIMGWVLSSLGRPEEGITRLQTVAERLEARAPSPALGDLYATLTHLFNRRGQRQDLAVVAERAEELAQTLGDERMRVQAELSRAFALLPDHVDEALAVLEHVIVAAEEVGDNTLFRALLVAAGAYAARGEFERSRTYQERTIVLSQQAMSPDALAAAVRPLGDLHFVQGDWSAARENYERAAAMTSSLAAFEGGWVRLSLARLCLVEGKWHEAAGSLEEGMTVVERTGDRPSIPKLQSLLAARDLWQGQADAALARLEALLSQFDLDHDELMILAEAYMAIGSAARAEEVVTSGAERAATQNYRLALVDWWRLQGMLLAGQGQWEAAERVLKDACSLASDLPYPYGKARILYEWGRTCLKTGASREARSHLEDALAIFRELGARPYIERTEQVLDSHIGEPGHCRLDGEVVRAGLEVTGHVGRGRVGRWPASLTDREVEVLRLIATGASYRDVARELGISPKTVRHHIEHVYNKIGVTTRAEAAIFAMEHGLVPR